jgi:hypothetical protein
MSEIAMSARIPNRLDTHKVQREHTLFVLSFVSRLARVS